MKITPLFQYLLAICLFTILAAGCEKNDIVDAEAEVETETETKNAFKRDSLYFEVNGKPYSSNNANKLFYSNSGVNLSYSDTQVEGMKQWVSYGGGASGYYSPVDSIYFGYGKAFDHSNVVSFNKRFHKNDLVKFGMLNPKDIRKMIEKGKQKFAVDAGSKNSFDGVYLQFGGLGNTGIPEGLYRESPEKYNQDDAYFEIIKTEDFSTFYSDFYRIEAKFEVNVYKGDSKTRITNGYLVINIQRQFGGTYFY